MAAQLLIFADFLKKNKKEKKKRIRYLIPTYKKVYSIFQYDQQKYMDIWKRIRELAIKLNKPSIFFDVSPQKVLRLCYIRENGHRKHLGDSKHIYRLKSLYKIQAHLFNYSRIPLNLNAANELKWERSGVLFFYDHYDGGYAEIIGTDTLPIKERVILHIRLLRYLRQGKELRKAVRLCQMKPLN